jgi:hypothetical protein
VLASFTRTRRAKLCKGGSAGRGHLARMAPRPRARLGSSQEVVIRPSLKGVADQMRPLLLALSCMLAACAAGSGHELAASPAGPVPSLSATALRSSQRVCGGRARVSFLTPPARRVDGQLWNVPPGTLACGFEPTIRRERVAALRARWLRESVATGGYVRRVTPLGPWGKTPR